MNNDLREAAAQGQSSNGAATPAPARQADANAAPAQPQPTPPTPKLYHESMPRLGLELNTRVLVNLNPLSNETAPLAGEFLGAVHYEFMILRLPSLPGLIKKLLPQTRLEIIYSAEGATNRFVSEVISHVVRPALLLFCSYPDRMSIMETRKHQRVTCALPVHLATPYGDAIAAIRDLSRGGCRIVLEMTGQSAMRKLASGDRVVMQTPLSMEQSPTRGIGLVRNVETSGSRLTVGLAFDESNKAFSGVLAEYLALMQVLD